MTLAVAVCIFFATLALTLMTMLSYGMSDNPKDNVSNVPIVIFTMGIVLSIAVGASYWM